MRDRLAIGAGILLLTLLSYFQFPGHTYLGSDTQIYVPMMEHIWDPSVLSRDLVATTPHLAFTLYDEIAITLRWITHSSFHAVLVAQQLLFRALQIFGVFLLALSFPLAKRMAMLVAALFTLGATIAGPAVLIFEYEPVPRAFAVGLVFLAIGLAAQEHLMLADIAAALAFLYHPPTVLMFWAIYLWLVLRHRDYRDLWPLVLAVIVLLISSRFQPGASEPQVFFSRVGAELEKLQRMRAAYNWVSTWRAQYFWHYLFLWAVSLVAFWRVQPKTGRMFVIGMPALGILSILESFLLLEKLKWGLIPQIQPARAVLFVAAFAIILGAAAGIRAAEGRRWLESFAWFAIVLAVPASSIIFNIVWPTTVDGTHQLLLDIAMALALVASLAIGKRFPWAPAVAAVIPFFVWPGFGLVHNYSRPDFTALHGVEQFARDNTPKESIFLFGDAKSGAAPSIFRAEGLRAVYVDWKSGGQINFSESLGMEWWRRWQQVNKLQFDPARAGDLAALGVDYLVLETGHRLPEKRTVYENAGYVVYRLTGE